MLRTRADAAPPLRLTPLGRLRASASCPVPRHLAARGGPSHNQRRLVQVGQMLRLDLYSENIPVNLFGARARGGPRDVPARRPRGRAAGRGAARRVAAEPAIPTVSALDLVLL